MAHIVQAGCCIAIIIVIFLRIDLMLDTMDNQPYICANLHEHIACGRTWPTYFEKSKCIWNGENDQCVERPALVNRLGMVSFVIWMTHALFCHLYAHLTFDVFSRYTSYVCSLGASF